MEKKKKKVPMILLSSLSVKGLMCCLNKQLRHFCTTEVTNELISTTGNCWFCVHYEEVVLGTHLETSLS